MEELIESGAANGGTGVGSREVAKGGIKSAVWWMERNTSNVDTVAMKIDQTSKTFKSLRKENERQSEQVNS